VSERNRLKVVCDIVQQALGLADDQVYLWDQKITPPTDRRLYVAVAALGDRIFGTSTRYVPTPTYLTDEAGNVLTDELGNRLVWALDPNSLSEQVSQSIQTTFQLDIFSRSSEARDRRFEVVRAISLAASQALQLKYGVSIGMSPKAMVNLSEVDGAAIPYRFTITGQLLFTESSIPAALGYYDSARVTLKTEA
jgi:hypothetical protein